MRTFFRHAWEGFNPVPEHAGMLRARCPWCRRVLVVDEGRRVTSHEAPVCAGFERLMQQARDELGPGAARELGPELLPFGDDDKEVS
jgi:hypothetical protein